MISIWNWDELVFNGNPTLSRNHDKILKVDRKAIAPTYLVERVDENRGQGKHDVHYA